jgi:hypothetical protein
MTVAVRRFVYSLLTALGFIMMVPWMISMRRLQAAIGSDPVALEQALEPGGALYQTVPGMQGDTWLFLLGLTLAACFLYAALSVGTSRAWRPRQDKPPCCSRCESEVAFGAVFCPTCEQRLVW